MSQAKKSLRVTQSDITRIAPLVTDLINKTHGTNLRPEQIKYLLTPENIKGTIPGEAEIAKLRTPGSAARFEIMLW